MGFLGSLLSRTRGTLCARSPDGGLGSRRALHRDPPGDASPGVACNEAGPAPWERGHPTCRPSAAFGPRPGLRRAARGARETRARARSPPAGRPCPAPAARELGVPGGGARAEGAGHPRRRPMSAAITSRQLRSTMERAQHSPLQASLKRRGRGLRLSDGRAGP